MHALKLVLSAALLAGVAGCQTIKPSEDTLKQRTEFILNTKVSNVADVRSDSTITYYTATTAKGRYECRCPAVASSRWPAWACTSPRPPA